MVEESSPVHIPSLNARVTELRFYEGGWDSTSRDARVYTNIFSGLTTRYISWELNLAYPPQPERIDYEIEAVFYRPDGTVFSRQTAEAYVKEGRTNSWRSRGRGWREPRKWRPGVYKVELSIDEQLVASGEFEIVDSRIPVEGPFADLTENLAWASLPWSLEEELALLSLTGLMETDPKLASDAASLPWVRESLTGEGRRVLQLLDILAREDVELAKRVVALPWLADDMTKDEWLALRALTLLAAKDAAVAGFIADFPWLADDVTEDERKTIVALYDIAAERPSLAKTLFSLPWLSDHLTKQEGLAVRDFSRLSRRDPQVAQQVADMRFMDGPIRKLHRETIWSLGQVYDASPQSLTVLSARTWFNDGLNEEEAQLVADIGNIAWKSTAGALAISSMPFLETIEPADVLATTALRRLAYFKSEDNGESEEASEHFQRVMAHPAISDGITDEEAKIVATLRAVSEHNPDLVDTLLDPDKVTLEERTINLPLAGDVQLTIIRTQAGAERTMDLLEEAVRAVEEFMAAPFPQPQVTYLFEEAAGGSSLGTNFRTNITSRPKVDEDGYSEESAFRHIVHETSHYYWTGNKKWINEGAATFIETIATNATTGELIAPEKTPCAYASNIAALESLDLEKGSPEFSCNYSLGERLFHDLYRSLGENAFRRGFRNLYLLSQADNPGDGCAGTDLDICHVGAAFKTGSTPDVAATVDRVIARWYHGSEPYDTSHQDTDPVDPNLPGVKGMITRVYIVLDKDRYEETETDRFSAKEVEDWVYLFLHFSYPRIQEEQELRFDVVEFFEDGFAYRHRNRTSTFKAGWTGSWSWFSIGLDPERRKWNPGRYWVYAYHEGQKVAEVEYLVTP